MHIKGIPESEVIFANHLLDVPFVNSEAGPVFDFGCSRSLKTPILFKIKPGVLFTYLLDSFCQGQKISLLTPQSRILMVPFGSPLSFPEITKLSHNVLKVNIKVAFKM